MSEVGPKKAGAKMPPDLDRLAWSVAEGGDPRARAAFAARHPEWADELERRVEVVIERREVGRSVEFARGAPLEGRGSRRPLGLAAALFGGLAVGGAVLAGALLLIAPRAAEPVAGTPPSRLGGVPSGAPSPPVADGRTQTADVPPSIPPSEDQVSKGSDEGSEAPTTIRLRRTSLHAALGLIGEAGGLRVRIDPAVPDPEVQEDLVDLTPREMIASLGGRYGFRVVPEGPSSLFLVPLPEGGEGGGERAGEASDLPPDIGGTQRTDESR